MSDSPEKDNHTADSPQQRPHRLSDALLESPKLPEEIGGSDKPEPTRYGDWEVDGRCTDF